VVREGEGGLKLWWLRGRKYVGPLVRVVDLELYNSRPHTSPVVPACSFVIIVERLNEHRTLHNCVGRPLRTRHLTAGL
jgi:hypothetical protein